MITLVITDQREAEGFHEAAAGLRQVAELLEALGDGNVRIVAGEGG